MALIEKLEAIGDAIRAKTGGTELLTLDAMPQEIAAIETGGGGGSVEPIVLSGECEYACGGKMGAEFIKLYGDKISTKDITGSRYMFYFSTLERIPFELNYKQTTKANMANMFDNCLSLTEVSKMNNAYPSSIAQMFKYCSHLRYLPDDLGTTWNWNEINTYSYAGLSEIFSNCHSLRKIPQSFLSNLWGKQTSGTYLPYKAMFDSCYALDEVNNVPIHQATLSTNAFSTTFTRCYRLKNLTFATNEDGTAKTATWKSQTIDLSSNIGWTNSENNILNYNSGITKADKINNTTHSSSAEAVAAMNSNPNWYTDMYEYSRYGKNAAIATINSLPDTTVSGGTNTIKFKANAGTAYSLDGVNQKIGDLTAEQIAVATAKGWTVSLV